MAQSRTKTKKITEFGDFQTPVELAAVVTKKLRGLGVRPRSIIEPTCGKGSFLLAAADTFPEVQTVIGVEINASYIESAAAALRTIEGGKKVRLRQGDFFAVEWSEIVAESERPWLIFGNPPWVTSSSLGTLASENLPDKSNFHGRAGIEAVTGKSNFDISEWMLLRYLDWLQGTGTIAVLCKTAVARKILAHIWKKPGVEFSRIYKIDAMANFGAAVDACLFIIGLAPHTNSTTCEIFDSLEDQASSSTISYCKGHLVTDASPHELETLWGPETFYLWRSGVKHDCSRVMELFSRSEGYSNGLGEHVGVEDTFLYPMLKGSDIGNGRIRPRAKLIVTQRMVGQPTGHIAISAPNTWAYLKRHEALLNKRGSVIYKGKPAFSIFGVGPYTFAPWKLAVSSFYKKLLFVSVGRLIARQWFSMTRCISCPAHRKERLAF